MNCIFCKINNGEIPSYTVYEDNIVRVMMDINPVTDGHLLIIPKKHFDNMRDIDTETLTHIQKIAQNMFDLLKNKLNIDGLTLCQNNEYGQEIKHYHLHLIPRYKSDNVRLCSSKKKESVETIYKNIIKEWLYFYLCKEILFSLVTFNPSILAPTGTLISLPVLYLTKSSIFSSTKPINSKGNPTSFDINLLVVSLNL